MILRRIVYTNPEDGVTYNYLTTDFTLPAYQLVLLYKHRWDIEKIFHQLKSKMYERKSWASSLTAKQSHAIFECLAHNLLLLFEERVIREEGIRDEVEEKKQIGRTRPKAAGPGVMKVVAIVRNFINTAVTRATQRTQRFIRWVRCGFTSGYCGGANPWPACVNSGPSPHESFPHRSMVAGGHWRICAAPFPFS